MISTSQLETLGSVAFFEAAIRDQMAENATSVISDQLGIILHMHVQLECYFIAKESSLLVAEIIPFVVKFHTEMPCLLIA